MKIEFIKTVIVVTCALTILGCAGMEPPMPDKLISHPLGSSPVGLGMSKDEVKDALGEPNSITYTGKTDSSGLTSGEVWLYNSWLKDMPINRANLSKTLRLTFDGNSLTSYKEE
ncbi:MAG: hypothetical protein NTV07_03240 [Candidatus Omnitrophica bacterium]|nr:hypothetical protein [Candidatus Omnitrophota bacterium]